MWRGDGAESEDRYECVYRWVRRRKIGKGGRDIFSTAREDEKCSIIFVVPSSRGSTAQLCMHMHVGFYSYVFRNTRMVEVVDGVAVSCTEV